jgi:hypothetical protein
MGQQDNSLTLQESDFDHRVKFTCPRCNGRWKAVEDARACHGMEPCTRQPDCEAISHWGDCKSMPSTDPIARAKRDLAVKVLAAIDSVSHTKEHGEHRDPWALKLAVELKVRELFTAEGINIEQASGGERG